MIRSYYKPLILRTGDVARNKQASESLSVIVSDALVAIQEHGGEIVKVSLYPVNGLNAYIFFVVYEDNSKYDEINSFLRDSVFNFTILKL